MSGDDYEVDEFWWAPVLIKPGEKRPSVHYKYMRRTRSFSIQEFVFNAYEGKHDWAYCRKMGWRMVRLRISTTFWR